MAKSNLPHTNPPHFSYIKRTLDTLIENFRDTFPPVGFSNITHYLEKASRFLMLVSLVLVLLIGVTMALQQEKITLVLLPLVWAPLVPLWIYIAETIFGGIPKSINSAPHSSATLVLTKIVLVGWIYVGVLAFFAFNAIALVKGQVIYVFLAIGTTVITLALAMLAGHPTLINQQYRKICRPGTEALGFLAGSVKSAYRVFPWVYALAVFLVVFLLFKALLALWTGSDFDFCDTTTVSLTTVFVLLGLLGLVGVTPVIAHLLYLLAFLILDSFSALLNDTDSERPVRRNSARKAPDPHADQRSI